MDCLRTRPAANSFVRRHPAISTSDRPDQSGLPQGRPFIAGRRLGRIDTRGTAVSSASGNYCRQSTFRCQRCPAVGWLVLLPGTSEKADHAVATRRGIACCQHCRQLCEGAHLFAGARPERLSANAYRPRHAGLSGIDRRKATAAIPGGTFYLAYRYGEKGRTQIRSRKSDTILQQACRKTPYPLCTTALRLWLWKNRQGKGR